MHWVVMYCGFVREMSVRGEMFFQKNCSCKNKIYIFVQT